MTAATTRFIVIDDNGNIPLWHGTDEQAAHVVAAQIEQEFDREVRVREPRDENEWANAVATVGPC